MSDGYYDVPLLKPPVWTWEVPAYFFAGGAAGASAVIAAAAQWTGGDPLLVRNARWIAAAGAGISTPLLISDLGRPERFLNMLRVFKIRSPMSVGAWTLAVFGAAAGAAAVAEIPRLRRSRLVRTGGDAAAIVAAAAGLVMSTYTGVLIGATSVPLWAKHVSVLPIHFAASSLGSAASILELTGRREPVLNRIGMGAAAAEAVISQVIGRKEKQVVTGRAAMIASTLLSGAVPLALRLLAGKSPKARRIAALATVAGSLLTRIAWIEAGRASTREPGAGLT